MFSKLLSYVKSAPPDRPGSAQGSEQSFKDVDESISGSPGYDFPYDVFRAAIYKLNGVEADLLLPSADIKFGDSAFYIDDPEEGSSPDHENSAQHSWSYESVMSIRQHIPESVQFVEPQTNNEWGFHFNTSEMSSRFRSELMSRIRQTCDDNLAKSNVTIEQDLPDSHNQAPSADSLATGIAYIRQRESDSLTLFCLEGGEQDSLGQPKIQLIAELTRDLHLDILDVEKGEICIWGPFEERGHEWKRIWWTLRGLSENMLLVMTHSFGIEEKILRPIVANYDDDSSTAAAAAAPVSLGFDDDELHWVDEDENTQTAPKQICHGHGEKVQDSPKNAGAEEWVADLDEEYADDEDGDYDEQPHVKVERPEDAARHKFMEVGTSHSFVCRAKGVKNQWWDGQNRERDYEMHVYNNDNSPDKTEVQSQVIRGSKFVYKDKAVNPTKALIPGFDDARMMLVDGENDPQAVYHFDVEKEKVVTKYDTGGLEADILWRTVKGEQTGQTFMAASSDSFYMMDTRQQQANVNKKIDAGLSARSYTRQYKTSTNFTAAASDAMGHIAIGNRTGVIRLYDGAPNESGDFKIAKTQLDAKADVIKSIDTLLDGSWVVATMKECLVLYPTKLKNSEKTGFEMRLGNNKPEPLYLTLEPRDIRKYKLDDIDFRPAVFNEAQESIITSTGSLAIIWDLKAIRQGKLTRIYKIKKMDQEIQETKATADGKVLVAHPRRVEILPTTRK